MIDAGSNQIVSCSNRRRLPIAEPMMPGSTKTRLPEPARRGLRDKFPQFVVGSLAEIGDEPFLRLAGFQQPFDFFRREFERREIAKIGFLLGGHHEIPVTRGERTGAICLSPNVVLKRLKASFRPTKRWSRLRRAAVFNRSLQRRSWLDAPQMRTRRKSGHGPKWPCMILGHLFGAGLPTSPKPPTGGSRRSWETFGRARAADGRPQHNRRPFAGVTLPLPPSSWPWR